MPVSLKLVIYSGLFDQNHKSKQLCSSLQFKNLHDESLKNDESSKKWDVRQ